jgi:hypothetical protein
MKGIEANPDKIQCHSAHEAPQSRKEVQRLTDRIAALNRFMDKLAERSLPFFIVLRGLRSFQWGPEHQAVFDTLKDHIQKLSMLASPQSDQPLILYVSVTHTAVSGVIVQEREVCKEGRKLSQEVSIYFVFEALDGSKKYYSKIEKIYYAVVLSARKLCHYFKAHRVRVLTNQPLNDILGNRDCSGRIKNGPCNCQSM